MLTFLLLTSRSTLLNTYSKASFAPRRIIKLDYKITKQNRTRLAGLTTQSARDSSTCTILLTRHSPLTNTFLTSSPNPRFIEAVLYMERQSTRWLKTHLT